MRRARVYATAHGLYRLTVNGACPDERWLAPENTAYHKLLNYQTYDVTEYVMSGKNTLEVTLADGWWVGRVGTTGDCCQYGDRTALLINAEIEYMDGTRQTVTGEDGVSAPGPILSPTCSWARNMMPVWNLRTGSRSSGWIIPWTTSWARACRPCAR